MENVIDIRTALEQLGTGWQFGGSVTGGTQQDWDAVTWEDNRAKPTWAVLCAAYDAATTAAQYAALRAARDVYLRDDYDPKITQLSRQLRLATTDDERAAITSQIAAWDAWAAALCNLPEQPGAPWPAGDIPWPVMPQI